MSTFLITVAENGYIVESVETNSVTVYEGEDISKEMYEELMMSELTTTLLSKRAQSREKEICGLPTKIKFEINVDYRIV